MFRTLFQPRWLIAHLVVVALAATFLSLGIWQLDRHEQRVEDNARGEKRLNQTTVALDDLMAESGDLASLEHRRVLATGVFDAEYEVLIRSQVHLGTAGFHVVTPLVRETEPALMVNRGWIPLTLDEVPVSEAPPSPGSVTIEGWVEMTEIRRGLGPVDPPGRRLDVMSRVDLGRIAGQMPYPIDRVYVVLVDDATEGLPAPVDPPEFDDMGPHLAYAIQWFGFAAVGLVGYGFLLRRSLPQPEGSVGERARSSTIS